jgi:hypothetical protein
VEGIVGGKEGRKRSEEVVGERDAKSAQKSSDAVETEGEKVRRRKQVGVVLETKPQGVALECRL